MDNEENGCSAWGVLFLVTAPIWAPFYLVAMIIEGLLGLLGGED